MLPELRDDGVEDEGDEEKHLRDDQEGGGELAGDGLDHAPVLWVSEVTHPGHQSDLVTSIHILQTILVREKDMMMQVEAGRSQVELTGVIIENSCVTLRLSMDC